MSISLTQQALARLRKQRDEDYFRPWKPGQQPTDAEILWAHIEKLESQLSLAHDQISLYSWDRNPDRMGGQFSQADYDQAERSRQGIFG